MRRTGREALDRDCFLRAGGAVAGREVSDWRRTRIRRISAGLKMSRCLRHVPPPDHPAFFCSSRADPECDARGDGEVRAIVHRGGYLRLPLAAYPLLTD